MTRHLFWLSLLFFSSAFATITTEVKPSSIHLGDSFHLTLTSEGHSSNGMPDLIPLQHDFEIDSTEHRVSTTIINGNMQTASQWTILLTPKKTGTLPIPAIHIGGEQSNATHIEVSSNNASKPQINSKSNISTTPARVQLQTEVNKHTPYLHQQMLYTVKLIHQDQLLDATYQPPNLEDAIVVPLGDNEQYQITENNQTFIVEQQRYALFPQKIGKQTLSSPLFQALIYNGMPERVRLRNDPITLNVQPIPKSYPAKPWLPAKALSLTEEYDDVNTTLKAGTTLIRTIRIEGQAIPAELLPTLSAKPQDSFGVYPEKPASKNSIHDQDLVGIKTMRITYLLNQPGTITLPAYTVTWFNTTTNKEETSTLPSRTIHIQGKTSSLKQLTPSQATHQGKKSVDSQTPSIDTQAARTPWLIAASLGVMWILTILGFVIYKKKPRISQPPMLNPLKHACKTNNPIKARSALLAWARHQWPKAHLFNLDDITRQLHDDVFKRELSTLSEALYKKSQSTWQGDALWQCVKSYRAVSRKKQNKKTTLPPINPTAPQ